jgi:hypothetical protein
MEMTIRDWAGGDLPEIQRVWLDYCRNVARSDMQLRSDAEAALKQWLAARFRQHFSIGFVAERDGVFAGFLLARLDDWESVPPLIESRRIGIVDAVYVAERFQRDRQPIDRRPFKR